MNLIKTTALICVSATLLFSACSKQHNDSRNEGNTEVDSVQMAAGFVAFQKNCMSCHATGPSGNTSVAPTIDQVAQSYLQDNSTYESFLTDFTQFVGSPSTEKSKMPESVKKHGIMPNMSYSAEVVDAVAYYLFHSDRSASDWYAKDEAIYKTEVPYVSPAEYGKSLALQTKAVLGKNLLNAIKTLGSHGALDFCNLRAIHLTDSMSNHLRARIKRVSDQPRNPRNQASKDELRYLTDGKEKIKNGIKPSPLVTEFDKHYVGYYPILTNEMCLQCHGSTQSDIAAETLKVIKSKYPEDKAIDYNSNELRGIWVVQWEK